METIAWYVVSMDTMWPAIVSKIILIN